MGRNQRRKGGAKRDRNGEWTADKRDESTLHNAALEKYYRGKVISEDEWETFAACMRSPLPLSLRVNMSLPNAEQLADFVEKELSAVFTTTRLPFFPRSLAFQSNASRADLKRNAEHKHIKRLVAALNEGGYLTRQETVSMIPPILLNVQPGDRVLDMCSAPGSKTSQILECLVKSQQSGVVVANDLNSSRLDVLTHQTNRCPGAHAHTIITNADAMMYPLMHDADAKFDRVLCDVMCSGDGTLRKSMDLWARWNTLQGADLHSSQCRVLTRGMQLCKKGGVVVYSTCSLNPVEDEAVLSECLEKSKGSFRLVDPSTLLTGLRGSPGLFSWTITTKDLDAELRTVEEATAYRESRGGKGFAYRPSMFANEERLRAQNMQYAIRVKPHSQDTGGFFIAAMECVNDYPESTRALPSAPIEKPLRQITEQLKVNIRDSLGLPDSFPYSNLFFRSETAREQKIYYVCDAGRDLLPNLQASVAQVGAKVFEAYIKHSNEKLRFCAEGVATLAPLLPDTFFVRNVDPQVLLDMQKVAMNTDVFCRRANVSLDSLPIHSFVVESTLPHGMDVLRAAMERCGSTIVTKLFDWQVTLLKVALNLPIVTEAAEEGGVAEVAEEGDAAEAADNDDDG